MPDELKDQRVVTMMSPSELGTIDDWMFKNRIRSRGDAIRRLCQIGMSLDGRLPTILDAVLKGRTAEKAGLRCLENAIPTMPVEQQADAYKILTEATKASSLVMFALGAAILEEFPLKAIRQMNIGLEQARLMKDKVNRLDPKNDADVDELIRMLETISSRQHEKSDD